MVGQAATTGVTLAEIMAQAAFQQGLVDVARGHPAREVTKGGAAWGYERGRHYATWLVATGRTIFSSARTDTALLQQAFDDGAVI